MCSYLRFLKKQPKTFKVSPTALIWLFYWDKPLFGHVNLCRRYKQRFYLRKDKGLLSLTCTFRVALVSAAIPMSPNEVTVSFVFDEARRLAERGVEVHAVRLVEAKSLGADLELYGIRFHGTEEPRRAVMFFLRHLWRTLPPPGFTISPIWLLNIFNYGSCVAETVREHDLNIIHAHFAYPEGFVGLIAKRVSGKPLVVTLHGYDILTEHTIRYGSRLDPRVNAMIKKVLKGADAIVAASSAIYNAALEAGCMSHKLYLIPNGIDTKRFNPSIKGTHIREKLNVGKNPFVFTLRVHEPKNGIEYLIRAASLVLEEFPNVFFVIGGDGPLRQYHESLAKELGVSGNVVFVGRIPQSELPCFYVACDMFIIPSVIEAFGLVTIEAMACGKPVIGTDVGGIADIIVDGVNGFLVRPKDPAALAQKIILLLNNSKLREKMGETGREIVEREFNIEKRAEKIIKLYESL